MGANYRQIQADFSSGEIDPMAEANLNLPYRTNGLKESYNTLHLPNATVSKRPGLIREILSPFGNIPSHDAWTPVEVQMESGETCIIFLGATARIIIDGAFYDVPIYASEDEEETETIQLSAQLRHVAVYQQYIFISYPEDTETGILMLKVEKDETAGMRVYKPSGEITANLNFPSDIGACTRPVYVANGRLLIGSRNVFNTSKQRTEKQKESETGFPTWMLDFSLADYTYNWTYKYSATTSEGYEVKETIYYQSFNEIPPDDPFSKPDGIQQRIRIIKQSYEEPYATGFHWREWTVTDNYADGNVLITNIVEKISLAIQQSETTTYYGKLLDEHGNPIQEKDEDGNLVWELNDDGEPLLDSFGNKIPVYKYGDVEYEGIILTGFEGELAETFKTALNSVLGTSSMFYDDGSISSEILEAVPDKTVSTISSNSNPDVQAYPSNKELDEDSTPDPQATHAIQVRENDMYGSSIKWITMAGRIIVGTETAIHIAVDQYLDPRTFDLIITSYTGTSALQPKLLNQFVIFTSSDRKKLYMAIYSDESKGLMITEATANVKHLFLSGIKDYFISDNPYRVIYVLTNDNECRVCIPNFGTDGSVSFAWSTWDFGISHPEYICFDRRAENEQKTYFIMKDESTGNGWIYTLDYREPYLYGVKDTDLLLDYADIQTISNVRGSIALTSPFLKKYGSVDVMLTYADGKQAVLRDCPITIGNDGTCSVTVNYERPDLGNEATVTMKVGRAYETRIAFFQQLLPNNAGVSLITRHSIDKLFLKIYRSQGGSVWANGAKIADLLQLKFGIDVYNDNSINPLTDAPYTFSGVYTIDNPIQNVDEDNLAIITADPYPFNLIAISMKYTLSEVY